MSAVQADGRISMFLNNGSQSNPTVVVLLSPDMLDEQLNRACQAFVDYTVKVKTSRRLYAPCRASFVLPRVSFQVVSPSFAACCAVDIFADESVQ